MLCSLAAADVHSPLLQTCYDSSRLTETKGQPYLCGHIPEQLIKAWCKTKGLQFKRHYKWTTDLLPDAGNQDFTLSLQTLSVMHKITSHEKNEIPLEVWHHLARQVWTYSWLSSNIPDLRLKREDRFKMAAATFRMNEASQRNAFKHIQRKDQGSFRRKKKKRAKLWEINRASVLKMYLQFFKTNVNSGGWRSEIGE